MGLFEGFFNKYVPDYSKTRFAIEGNGYDLGIILALNEFGKELAEFYDFVRDGTYAKVEKEVIDDLFFVGNRLAKEYEQGFLGFGEVLQRGD